NAGTQVADGFFAKRENVAVLSMQPLDSHYYLLEKASSALWDAQFSRSKVLLGKSEFDGVPPAEQGSSAAAQIKRANARGWAMMLKVLENDSEVASISHAVARQLVYATGMLPRNVNAPEWLQFGLGSFF